MHPRLFLPIILALFATSASANDKYGQFLGVYVAAYEIANTCGGMTVLNPEGAASIAKSDYGLRRQKTLRLFHYGKTVSLKAQAADALERRGVDVNNKSELCGLGRRIVETDDEIGRFLKNR